jgi:adenylosuccinate synthase
MFQVIFLGHVVYVDIINKKILGTYPYMLSKNFCHGSWKGNNGIIQTKRHYIIVKQIRFGDQCNLSYIL